MNEESTAAKAAAADPTLEPMKLEPRLGSSYPAPFDKSCGAREKRALGDPLVRHWRSRSWEVDPQLAA